MYISILYIIIIYTFLVFSFFTLLNIFDVKIIKNLSDLKQFGIVFPVNIGFLITILSFAGIPPLFGFSIKLTLFLILLKGSSIFFIIVLTTFNFFTLYFYIQNVRYVINNSRSNFYIYINNFAYLSENVIFAVLAALVVNFGGIVYVSDIFLILSGFII